MTRPLFGLLAACLAAAATMAAEVEEKHANGQPRLKYTVDADGRKDGPCVEYFENGAPRIRSNFKQGKLHGAYVERTSSGAVRLTAGYRDGKLHGWKIGYINNEVVLAQAWKDGELVIPRGADQLRRKLEEIEAAPAGEKADTLAGNRAAGLRRLKAYRYLCGVPYEDLVLDDDLNRYAEAASRVCEKLGRLDHEPPNPGLPEDEYRLGRKGAGSSNLFWNVTDFPRCIDGWMDDSDPSNVEVVGHRRWCLNPPMKKTGLGRSGAFAAMYAFDHGRKEIPDWDFIGYPAPGLMPVGYFGPRHAWTVLLNPKKYRTPGAKVRVSVTPLDKDFDPAGTPLDLGLLRTDGDGFGVASCVIFRPRKVDVTPGSRYWVEVDDLRQIDGKPASIHYLVEFTSMK